VEYYVLVYPEIKKARIFKLEEDKYKKVLDATEDTFTFNLAECKITLDFSKVWP